MATALAQKEQDDVSMAQPGISVTERAPIDDAFIQYLRNAGASQKLLRHVVARQLGLQMQGISGLINSIRAWIHLRSLPPS